MNAKRPIDLQRESAGSMDIGTSDDTSAITSMVPIGDILYIIKERGIYAVKLADSIDPDRSNPNIPNTQQRMLAYGSESKIVGQTLLTAKQLFDKAHLSQSFDSDRAIQLSLDALSDLVAMTEALDSFQAAERKEIDDFQSRTLAKGALIVPAIGDVIARCKAYCHSADHFLSKLFDILKLFYGNDVGEGGFEAFAKLTAKKYGEDDAFSKFSAQIAPTLKYVRNARNCFEHPNQPTQQAVIKDFELRANGKIVLPSIEIIHRKNSYPPVDISSFMSDMTASLPHIFEVMLAYLCSKHSTSEFGLQTQVIELTDDQRVGDKKHVRFSFGMQIGDQVVPFG